MEQWKKEVDRLYLEKCKEVNELERRAESLKKQVEVAVKQKQEIKEQLQVREKELEELKSRMETQGGDLISREKVLEVMAEGRQIAVWFPDSVSTPDMETIVSGYTRRHEETLKLIKAIPAAPDATAMIRELAGERFKSGFIPNVAEPEPLPESLIEELPVWTLQTVSTQDILCLSSALKNLYDIHKCDGWLLYNKLAKVLEEAIDTYCSVKG